MRGSREIVHRQLGLHVARCGGIYLQVDHELVLRDVDYVCS